MRHATAVDIVRSLTDAPHLTVRDIVTSNHLDGTLDAVSDAISAGFIVVGHQAFPEILTLAEGIRYCQTCVDGCNHGGEQGSCGHRGCWGPAATNDCTGIAVARYADRYPTLYVTA
jgi:hypothetical protein